MSIENVKPQHIDPEAMAHVLLDAYGPRSYETNHLDARTLDIEDCAGHLGIDINVDHDSEDWTDPCDRWRGALVIGASLMPADEPDDMWANEFAIELLMPKATVYDIVRHEIAVNGMAPAVAEIAETFGVPDETMLDRLANMEWGCIDDPYRGPVNLFRGERAKRVEASRRLFDDGKETADTDSDITVDDADGKTPADADASVVNEIIA